MNNEIRIALIGYKFMGKAHSHGYRAVPLFFDTDVKPVLKVICGRNEAEVARAAGRLGWEAVETDWRKAVCRDDVDLVDICSPVDSHCTIAVEAIGAGKAVVCEKPLARDVREAATMAQAAAKAGVPNMVAYTFRHIPAVRLAKELIEAGELGSIYHWSARWLTDIYLDPAVPIEWRMHRDIAGSGVLGDIGSHIVDLAGYLVGPVTKVVGQTRTFVAQRPYAEDPARRGQVDVEDVASFLAAFGCGATGVFECSKLAGGEKESFGFTIYGSKGALRYDYQHLNELAYYSVSQPTRTSGFCTIRLPHASHTYGGKWMRTPGHGDGYGDLFIHQAYSILRALSDGRPLVPSFRDGLAVQATLSAVEMSVLSNGWVSVSDVPMT